MQLVLLMSHLDCFLVILGGVWVDSSILDNLMSLVVGHLQESLVLPPLIISYWLSYVTDQQGKVWVLPSRKPTCWNLRLHALSLVGRRSPTDRSKNGEGLASKSNIRYEIWAELCSDLF